MSPSLTITSPTADVTVERGGQLSVTWEGVLVPRVAVVLTPRNYDHDATVTLAVTANTGHFHWTAPLDPAATGEYDLVLQAIDAGAIPGAGTAPIAIASMPLAIVDPPPAPPSMAVAADPPVPATWTEGDVITVAYTSQGLAGPVLVQVHSLALGLLFNVTTRGPTSGSISFVVPAPPQDPLRDAFILLRSADGAASAQTAPATYYPQRRLSQVTLPASTLYKGASYEVTWRAAGEPFPVAVMLYAGNATRETESGRPCLPWRDAAGQNYTGCVLSYDLVNEVCATAVDADGRLLEAGQCKPAATAAALVLTAGDGPALLSSDGRATLALPAPLTELPTPGSQYTVVMVAANPGTKAAARSAPFAIEAPAVRLDFGVLLAPGADATAAFAAPDAATDPLPDLMADFLANALGVDRARVSVERVAEAPSSQEERQQQRDGDAANSRFDVRATIAPPPDATRVSAVEAGEAFVRGWPHQPAGDESAAAPAVPPALAAVGFQLDASAPPSLLVGPDGDGADAGANGRRERWRRRLAAAVEEEGPAGAPPEGGPPAVFVRRSPRAYLVVGAIISALLAGLVVAGALAVRRRVVFDGRGVLLSAPGGGLRVHAAVGSVVGPHRARDPAPSLSSRV